MNHFENGRRIAEQAIQARVQNGKDTDITQAPFRKGQKVSYMKWGRTKTGKVISDSMVKPGWIHVSDDADEKVSYPVQIKEDNVKAI